MNFDSASSEWKKSVNKSITKATRNKKYSWHFPRCGFLLENGSQCLKKSHFTKTYKREHHVIDVDACDLVFYCYNHIKNKESEKIKQRILMEKKILKRIKTQEYLIVYDMSYIEKLKEKYKNNIEFQTESLEI